MILGIRVCVWQWQDGRRLRFLGWVKEGGSKALHLLLNFTDWRCERSDESKGVLEMQECAFRINYFYVLIQYYYRFARGTSITLIWIW